MVGGALGIGFGILAGRIHRRERRLAVVVTPGSIAMAFGYGRADRDPLRLLSGPGRPVS